MKILIFTDSRGEHKATFNKKQMIFTEKLKKNFETKGHKVDLATCPYKWTTTFDFIECCENGLIDINSYDHVVLYTGIVEYSPRPQEDLLKNIYNNEKNEVTNLQRLFFPPNKKKSRNENEKKNIMNKLFGEKEIQDYFNKPFETKYRNQPTINLLSKDMVEKNIIPWLKQHIGDKLLFINCNQIVHGWEGNYLKRNKYGRPKNINIISKYSKIMKNNFDNIIDLSLWTDNDVKKFTIDNMHLTYEGSEWIYNKICGKLLN